MRAAIENARRWGAVGVFRLASRILRYAMTLHWQRRTSHSGLRTVLSGTRLLERFGALLALGRRRNSQQVEQDFSTALIFGFRTVSCVARTSLDDAIQQHRRGSFLQLRMSCNTAWECMAPSFDPDFDRKSSANPNERAESMISFHFFNGSAGIIAG
jgi:hypothetical protein